MRIYVKIPPPRLDWEIGFEQAVGKNLIELNLSGIFVRHDSRLGLTKFGVR